MSATVKAEDFASYFGQVNGETALKPVKIPGRMFPVEDFYFEEFEKQSKCLILLLTCMKMHENALKMPDFGSHMGIEELAGLAAMRFLCAGRLRMGGLLSG